MNNKKTNKGMPIGRDERTKSIGRQGYKEDGTKYNMPIQPDNYDLDRSKALEEAFRRQII